MPRRAYASKARRAHIAAGLRCVLISSCVAAWAGCASFRPVEPANGPVSLGRTEGLLVLHVDTDIPLGSIAISGATAARNLPVGVHTRLVAAPAGSYRWDHIVPLDRGRGLRFMLPTFDDDWLFHVDAGRINYPGLLVVRKGPPGLVVIRMGIYTTNRSGMMLRRFERAYPALLEQFPMKYTGRGRDEFLERFRAARDAHRAAQARTAGAP